MTAAASTDPLVRQLLGLLAGGNAHVTLAAAVEDFPEDARGTVPKGAPHSAWQLLEHLRITQRDILDFSSPGPDGYKPLDWPREYWPVSTAPPTPETWDRTLAALQADAHLFAALLTSPGADLYTPFPWGEGQNLLREALLLADHNSYHLGELVLVRRLLGVWTS